MAPATSKLAAPILQHDGASERCGTYTPEDDSPPVLFIGSRASAENIARLAQRHGLDPLALFNFSREG